MQTLEIAMIEALIHTTRANRAVYSRPAAHYSSPRRRNRDTPSKRGERKRAEFEAANAKHAKQKLIEAAWRDGRYPKPAWAHSSATTRLTVPMPISETRKIMERIGDKIRSRSLLPA